eukprot:scaffold11367_cov142-Isochrysis_galbana.AAC.3
MGRHAGYHHPALLPAPRPWLPWQPQGAHHYSTHAGCRKGLSSVKRRSRRRSMEKQSTQRGLRPSKRQKCSNTHSQTR